MKVSSKYELENILDADDRRYGLRALGTSEQDEILEKYADREYVFKKKDFDEKLANNRDELIDEAAYYYYKNADIYYKHLKNTGVLELPDSLSDLNFEKLLNKLKAIEPRSYICKIDTFNSNYSKAIKVLQIKLSLDDTGVFNKTLGLKIYEEIGIDISTGDGYFASENNPDFLFDYYFKEYVTHIDDYIWKKLNLESKFLVPDNDSFWTRKEDDEACEKALEKIKYAHTLFGPTRQALPEFREEYIEPDYPQKTRVSQIIEGGQNKAKDIIREMLKEEFIFAPAPLSSFSGEHMFKTKYTLAKNAYENEKNSKGDLADGADALFNGVATAGELSTIKGIKKGKIALATVIYLSKHLSPEPGLGDIVSTFTDKPKEKKIQKKYEIMEKEKQKYDKLKNTQGAFFMYNNIFHNANKKIKQLLTDEIYSNSNANKYSYTYSQVETTLYNTMILLYLQEVKELNADYKKTKELLDAFMYS